jgi:hypothetical protein
MNFLATVLIMYTNFCLTILGDDIGTIKKLFKIFQVNQAIQT